MQDPRSARALPVSLVLCMIVHCVGGSLTNFKVPMRVLLLSPLDDADIYPGLAVARTAFSGQNVPYDEFHTSNIYASNFTEPLPLFSPGGLPKYQAIVLVQGELVMEAAPNYWVSSLGTAQWQELLKYRRDYGARMVSLVSNLETQPSLNSLYTSCASGSQAVHIVPDSATLSGTSFNWNGVSANSAEWSNSASWSYRCDAVVPPPSVNVQPLLRFSSVTSGHLATDSHAAAVVTYEEGEEELHFFFVNSLWAPQSAPLASAWVPWLLRDMFLGLRRMYFLVQLDDLFAPEQLWNIALRRPGEDGEPTYRPTVDDLLRTMHQQDEWNLQLPTGSDVKLSHPFNGWWANPSDGADPLYEFVRDFGRDKFFYISHTFQHLNLDERTYLEVWSDFQQNLDFLNHHLFADGRYLDNFSPESCVTPQISGLENGNALRAMYDFGIRSVVGDNSIPRYRPTNYYHGWYTTAEANGFEGMLVLPRQATQIYFDCLNDTDTESRYNYTYYNQTGFLSLSEIIENDVALMMQGFQHFRHDPYMMHTANIKNFLYQGENTSLVDLWVKEFIGVYAKYFSFPLLTLKQDDLAKSYIERQVRDACGIVGTMVVENCYVTKVILEAAGTCTAVLTGIRSSAFGSGEQYGPDYNLRIPMSASSSETILLDTPLPLAHCTGTVSATSQGATTGSEIGISADPTTDAATTAATTDAAGGSTTGAATDVSVDTTTGPASDPTTGTPVHGTSTDAAGGSTTAASTGVSSDPTTGAASDPTTGTPVHGTSNGEATSSKLEATSSYYNSGKSPAFTTGEKGPKAGTTTGAASDATTGTSVHGTSTGEATSSKFATSGPPQEATTSHDGSSAFTTGEDMSTAVSTSVGKTVSPANRIIAAAQLLGHVVLLIVFLPHLI